MSKTPLFVYGTLRKGCRNHSLLAGAQYAGPWTALNYRRFQSSLGPAVVAAPGERVDGEVYLVDEATLQRLDAHEHADQPDGRYKRVELVYAHGFNPHMYLYVGEAKVEKLRVDTSPMLYHGTAWPNLLGVLTEGLRPRQELGSFSSPHQTKTRSATFLTDEFQAALGYSMAGDTPGAVLEIDVTGLELEPDYDDAEDVLSVDVGILQDALEEAGIEIDVCIGAPVPPDQEDAVEAVIDDLQGFEERPEPFTLKVAYDAEGQGFLAADPVVPFWVDSSLAHSYPELYDDADLAWAEGSAYLDQRQYLYQGSIQPSAIEAVWVPADLVPSAPGKREVFRHFGKIDRPVDAEGDPIEVFDLQAADRLDEVQFHEVPMIRLTPEDVRQLVAAHAVGESSPTERLLKYVPPQRPEPMPEMPCLALNGRLAVTGEPSNERVARGGPSRLAPAPGTPAWRKYEAAALHALARRGIEAEALLACGGLGCAYAITGQPGLVVKITGDPSEAAAAQKVVRAVGEGRASWAQDLPALVRFMCVYAFEDVPLFAILQERLASHLPDEANEFVWKHKMPMSHRFALVAGKSDDNKMRQRLRSEAQTRGLLPEFDRLLTTLDTLRLLHIEWHDLHTGNIMQDSEGHWRVLDLGESYTGYVEIPSFRALPEDEGSVNLIERLRVRRISASIQGDADTSRDTYHDPTWNADAAAANEVLRTNGILLKDYLGCGSYGCAFDQEPGVIKLTQDVNEAVNAKIVQRNGGCPGIAQIRAVYTFDTEGQMYAILMEKLEPLTTKERDFLENPLGYKIDSPPRIDSKRWEYHNGWITHSQYTSFIRKVQAAARKKLSTRGASAVESLIEGVECLYALGVQYIDGHADNILARKNKQGKRELVYFDLGHSIGPDTQVSVMERVP